jgi:quercetin dioxygenase-like cupin family protein
MAALEHAELSSPLPQPRRFITTHNDQGTAIYSDTLREPVEFWAVGPKNDPAGFGFAYATSSIPVRLSGDQDLAEMRQMDADRKLSGLVKRGGSILRYVDYPPQSSSPMHRTVSCDFGIVLFGEMECLLDSEETRNVRVGDVVVQRGAMHQWFNRGEKWARMIYVLLDATEVEFNGTKLAEVLGGMSGVAHSG